MQGSWAVCCPNSEHHTKQCITQTKINTVQNSLLNIQPVHYCSRACKPYSLIFTTLCLSIFSPSFSKLQEWLENLLMHLNIGLPLLSELEQLRRAFWQTHNPENHPHYQDKTLNSHEQTHCSQPQRQSPDPKQCSDNTHNHIEPNHLTQSQDHKNSTPDSHLDGEQHTQDNPDMRTEHNSRLSRECNDLSQDKSQTCCRSTSTDSDNGPETYEHNNKSLQDNSSLLGQSNRPRRISKVLWDRATEDSSFL